MLPQVKLVGQIKIDYQSFFSDLKHALGRTVTVPIDEIKANPESQASLLVAFSEMLAPGQNYYRLLKNPGSVCKHLHFSFLAVDLKNHSVDIVNHTSLACHSVPCKQGLTLHLISGNLEQWRVAVINCCSDSVPEELNILFKEFLIKFDTIGLRDLWINFSRKQENGKLYLK